MEGKTRQMRLRERARRYPLFTEEVQYDEGDAVFDREIADELDRLEKHVAELEERLDQIDADWIRQRAPHPARARSSI